MAVRAASLQLTQPERIRVKLQDALGILHPLSSEIIGAHCVHEALPCNVPEPEPQYIVMGNLIRHKLTSHRCKLHACSLQEDVLYLKNAGGLPYSLSSEV